MPITLRTYIRALGGALVLLACSQPDPSDASLPDSLTCEDASLRLSRELAAWDDPNACAVDADCVASAPIDLACANGARLRGCPVPIHADSTSSHAAYVAGVMDALCDRVDPDCQDGPQCLVLPTRCVGGQCTFAEL